MINARGNHPTVASLFAGCGGFDLGFKSEGFRPVAAFDIDPVAVGTFNANIVNVARVCDLSDTTPQISADVVLAGSPCQGFSTAGKRALQDPRNNLLVRAAEIALTIRPKVFVLENVPAAISGRHGSRWEQVEAILRADGYMVERIVAEGPASGVPQLRKRLFLLAWRGNIPVRCDLAPRASLSLMETIGEIGDASGHDPQPFREGSREARIAARIGPSQKLSNVRISPAAVHTWDIPEVFGAITRGERTVLEAVVRLRRRDRRRNFGDADPVEIERICSHLGRCCHAEVERLISIDYLRRVGDYIDLKHTYNGKFRRLPLDGPSPTVDTHFGDPALFLHPTEHRGLTPREAARIQGFPDGFEFGDVKARAFRMIGNAVPPPMAGRLARLVRYALLPVAA
ncbi:DNA cytosine methyltransferase [Amorphus sp. MBR-141]